MRAAALGAAVGVGPPFVWVAPLVVSAPQYRPANSTVAVGGSDKVAEDESKLGDPGPVPGAVGTMPGAVLTYTML